MGIGFVIIGAALLLLSFTTFNWYSGAGGPDSAGATSFSDLHHNAHELGAHALTTAYFGWASWVLLILLIVIGTFGVATRRQTEAIRVTGLLLGLVGAALTYYAVHDISLSGAVFTHASAGLWLTFVGYILAGVGAAIGPWPFELVPASSARTAARATPAPATVSDVAERPRPQPQRFRDPAAAPLATAAAAPLAKAAEVPATEVPATEVPAADLPDTAPASRPRPRPRPPAEQAPASKPTSDQAGDA